MFDRASLSKYALPLLAFTLLTTACAPTPGLYPNRDPVLRKPTGTFRKDAAQRIYPADAPRERGLAARAQAGYMAKTVDIVNLTQQDWTDVEVWVNQTYVCHLPLIEKGVLKSIPFDALFDRDGKYIPRDSRTFVVESVEVFFGGKLYDVPVRIAY